MYMKQDFTDGAVAANLATNEAQYPAALLTGKQDSARSGKKITLFTYMLTQGGTDRVAAILQVAMPTRVSTSKLSCYAVAVTRSQYCPTWAEQR
jgi:DNA-binding LytR/AlgR family response regulator